MTIEFECPECGRAMRAPDGAAGKQGQCPQCSTVMLIPSPPPAAVYTADGKLEFACPSCARTVRTPAAAAGKRGKCPHCQEILTIPEPTEEAPGAAESSSGAAPSSRSAPAPSPTRSPPTPPPSTAASTPPPRNSAVPAASTTTVEFACSQCQTRMRAPANFAGKLGKCPKCQTANRIPASSASPPPASSPAVRSTNSPPPPSPLDPFSAPPPDDLFGSAPDPGAMSAGPLGAAPGYFSDASPADGSFSVGAADAAGPFGAPGSLAPSPASNGSSSGANPYAAPSWTPAPAAVGYGGGSGGTTQVGFSELFEGTWSRFTPNLGPAILLALAMGGVNFGFNMLNNVTQLLVDQLDEPLLTIGVGVVMLVVSFLFNTWMQMSSQYACLRWAKTRTLTVSDFFSAGRFLLPTLGAAALSGLLIGGVVLVAVLPGALVTFSGSSEAGGLLLVGGALLATPVAVFLFLKFALANYFILDRGLGPIDCLRASFSTMTLGNMGVYMLAGICVLALVVIATLLTCCLGGLVAGPFLLLFTAVMYHQATGQGR